MTIKIILTSSSSNDDDDDQMTIFFFIEKIMKKKIKPSWQVVKKFVKRNKKQLSNILDEWFNKKKTAESKSTLLFTIRSINQCFLYDMWQMFEKWLLSSNWMNGWQNITFFFLFENEFMHRKKTRENKISWKEKNRQITSTETCIYGWNFFFYFGIIKYLCMFEYYSNYIIKHRNETGSSSSNCSSNCYLLSDYNCCPSSPLFIIIITVILLHVQFI